MESFRAPAQLRLAGVIDSSPRLAAQARRREALFGPPVQQQKAPAANHLPHEAEEDETYQLKAAPPEAAAQRTSAPNHTGLPDQLKAGIESLSGISMDHVRVHRNSSKPAQLHAHAYAQGSEIHLAPGQEKHLPHEAWHVVQQAQGRVKPTLQMKGGLAVNDDAGLEREADVMGARACSHSAMRSASPAAFTMPEMLSPTRDAILIQRSGHGVIQRKRPTSEIFNFFDQNPNTVVTGPEMKRILYWNEEGKFDAKGGRLNPTTIKRWAAKKFPLEALEVIHADLPEFMRIRREFKVNLPDFFGGAKLGFRKRPENTVFDNRGWISDNIYWRAPAHPRVQYMIHAILEWAGVANERNAPNPHITLRNAATQADIDLDITHPLLPSRTNGLEATRTSYAQGLGQPRQPGEVMVQDNATFQNLTSGAIQTWLTALINAAQAAIDEPPAVNV